MSPTDKNRKAPSPKGSFFLESLKCGDLQYRLNA